MKLNMNDLNPGTFFPWPGNEHGHEDDGITVRPLNHEKIRDITDAVTTKRRIKISNGFTTETIVNEDLQNELIWDYCIIEWSGLNDENGEPIPCTRENKVRLMSEHPTFPAMVKEFIEQAERDMLEQREDEEKNF